MSTPPQVIATEPAEPLALPDATPLPPADPALARFRLHMPVDVRSASLALIAFILSLYALHWSKEIVVPILCGIMVSYALAPIVNRMVRLHIPRALAATTLLSAIVGMLGWGAWALSDQTDALIDTVPSVTAKIRELSQRASDKRSPITRMQKVASDLAAAAAVAQAKPPAASLTRPAQPNPEAVDIRGYLLTGTLGAVAFLGKIAVILLVALFLLSSGNSFRRKMVKLAGPKLSQKKVTIETLDEITGQIQRFLLVQVGASLVVGVLTWLAFMAMGLNNAGVWGVVAGVTNLIPYVGAVLVGGGAAIVALVQFGTAEMAVAIAAASFAIHAVVGNLLTPWWMGRASKMSAVAVFITVLVFGWLWGVWGLLLGVPILLVVKSVCDRVDDLKPLGELLGA